MIMHIRKAGPGDLPHINCIYNQAVNQGFCTAHLEQVDMVYRKQWFDRHQENRFPVFVVESRSKVQAWLSLSPYRQGRQALDHVAEVSYYVDRDFRRKGAASLLMDHAIQEAPTRGICILIAILLDKNPASIALLQKYAFSRWAALPGIALIKGEQADHLYYGLKL